VAALLRDVTPCGLSASQAGGSDRAEDRDPLSGSTTPADIQEFWAVQSIMLKPVDHRFLY